MYHSFIALTHLIFSAAIWSRYFIILFYRYGNWGTEKLSGSPKVTQLVSAGVGIKIQMDPICLQNTAS